MIVTCYYDINSKHPSADYLKLPSKYQYNNINRKLANCEVSLFPDEVVF